jgi:hypothetical protein
MPAIFQLLLVIQYIHGLGQGCYWRLRRGRKAGVTIIFFFLYELKNNKLVKFVGKQLTDFHIYKYFIVSF